MENETKEYSQAGVYGYVFLAIFFGIFGTHNFYANRIGVGIAQFMVCVAGSLLIIGPLIALGWALYDAIFTRIDGQNKRFHP